MIFTGFISLFSIYQNISCREMKKKFMEREIGFKHANNTEIADKSNFRIK